MKTNQLIDWLLGRRGLRNALRATLQEKDWLDGQLAAANDRCKGLELANLDLRNELRLLDDEKRAIKALLAEKVQVCRRIEGDIRQATEALDAGAATIEQLKATILNQNAAFGQWKEEADEAFKGLEAQLASKNAEINALVEEVSRLRTFAERVENRVKAAKETGLSQKIKQLKQKAQS